jgi:hypothetical protein
LAVREADFCRRASLLGPLRLIGRAADSVGADGAIGRCSRSSLALARKASQKPCIMASPKKDKGAAAPEDDECANCCIKGSTKKGQGGATLILCTKCKLTTYCSRSCQKAHWKAGHQQHCLTPEERRAPQPDPAPAAQKGVRASATNAEQGPVECPICLDPLASGAVSTLPCTHTFHAACVAGLRSFGLKQVCPLCRAELPPGPEKLFDEAARRFFDVKRRVDFGEASWGALTKALRREMNEVIGMWRSAADQGHVITQFYLGCAYEEGHGVKQDSVEAARLYRKAADQGLADAQCNLGIKYAQGDGVKQDFGEAARWCRKAADQGHAEAQFILGAQYAKGQGVKQDFGEAERWLRKAANQGNEEAKKAVLVVKEMLREQRQAAAPASQPSSSRRCANCGVAEAAGSGALKPCSRCKAAVYCGKACQAQHWKAGGHKAVCK